MSSEMSDEWENLGVVPHEHPLQLQLLNEEHITIRDQTEAVTLCSRCGEEVSVSADHSYDPSYIYRCSSSSSSSSSSVEQCGAVWVLLPQEMWGGTFRTASSMWGGTFRRGVYHCSCGLDFHIKCALFTRDIAQKNLQELQHVPLVSTTTTTTEMNDDDDDDLGCCFGCREPLTKSTYFSLDCGFNLHQKCADLPIKLNHMAHRKHPLLLQFNSQRLPCNSCGETHRRGFLYTCLSCKFALHIECASPLPIIEEDESYHQHPFTLFWRQAPFICDACGEEGNCVAYICCTCNIIVHKNCTSLPRFIKHMWHPHRLSHTYYLQDEGFESWDCIICHDEVNAEYGSYCCSRCKVIAHASCALEVEEWYDIVSSDDDNEDLPPLPPGESIDAITCVLERNDGGEASKIKHVKHTHNLILASASGEKLTCSTSDSSESNEQHKYYCCDGCAFPISLSASFYYCSSELCHCGFFLHKACAEFPNLKLWWAHTHECKNYLRLTSGNICQCKYCDRISNGFCYTCKECKIYLCLRCAIIEPAPINCPGHDEHPLLFYSELDGECHACGEELVSAYHCKVCNFTVDLTCATQPTVAHHKIDDHLLALTYHDNNDYPNSHYCDICEERRDHERWFYSCATCDTSAHVKCVLGEKQPAIKHGITYKGEVHEIHPHPDLIFVKKMYYYPKCDKCGERCEDLALECAESGCNFIVHWTCIKPNY